MYGQVEFVKIVSIFADKNFHEFWIKNYKFFNKAIYSGDKIRNYRSFIENLGFYNKTDDENSNNLISLSSDNFERRFLRLIESDKKKDNLSIINNYKEDE